MEFFRNVGRGVNVIGGGVVESGVNIASSIVGATFPNAGAYMKEVGDTVVHSSRTVITNTSQFADGAATGIYGVVAKDGSKAEEGWHDVKEASSKTAKGMIGGVVYTGKSIGQTVQGVVAQDREQVVEGLKNVGKVSVVAIVGIGVLDFVTDTDIAHAHAEELDTRNAHLEGSSHAVTGVEFERQVYETDTNGVYTGVFPEFHSAFDVKLPEDTYQMSDTVHIGIANMELYEAIQGDPTIAADLGFDEQAVENLKSSVTPEGYEWHHHEEPGRIQLVDEEVHSQTGHTGGRSIWGGGTVSR
ncbi:HNH endonuclease [Sporosarcina sp. FSL K6-1508]|uniref:HNH endonuclease n=1 Tax=Sporosarcina sp. FSL K6-1508 TaxID=2921553 RepID=UPI0030F5D9F1